METLRTASGSPGGQAGTAATLVRDRLRALNLAQETLIIDGPALTYGPTQLNFDIFREREAGRPAYVRGSRLA